jgi:hypothetical protein
MSAFGDSLDALAARVGVGTLTGQVTFSAVYATVQHEAGWINFDGKDGPKAIVDYHGGGGSHYLSKPLLGNSSIYLQHLADAVLNGDLHMAMDENMVNLQAESMALAPDKDGELKGSASHSVEG